MRPGSVTHLAEPANVHEQGRTGTLPSHPAQAMAAFPGAEDLLDPAADAMDERFQSRRRESVNQSAGLHLDRTGLKLSRHRIKQVAVEA